MDASAFRPDLTRPRGCVDGRVTVVALSRLVYRKGVDLLNVVIPAVCRRQPHVDFIIGARFAFPRWASLLFSYNSPSAMKTFRAVHRSSFCGPVVSASQHDTVMAAVAARDASFTSAGGDGPMAGLLRATVRREGLESRVRMLGAVPSERVRDVLVRAGSLPVFSISRASPRVHMTVCGHECQGRACILAADRRDRLRQEAVHYRGQMMPLAAS